MNWQERIATDETIMTGKPVVKGTRMTVEFVVGLLGGGWSLDRILQEYDHLTKEDIQACLAYAAEMLKSERVFALTAA